MKLPPWARPFLLDPYRYKIAHGGRGSGKSWAMSLMILTKCRKKKQRVLACREIQMSIKASVHQLMSNIIFAQGWQYEFKITQAAITHLETGSKITFAGLKNNPESVKSTEGLDLVYIEEAQTISEDSMRLLIPTVRGQNSEIWMAINPRFESDYIYKRFIQETNDNVLCLQVNHTDNPWFPEVLKEELEYDRNAGDQAYYLHTWEGHLRPHGARAVFTPGHLQWIGTELPEPHIYGLDLSYTGKNALVGISVSEDGHFLNVHSASSSSKVPLQKMSEWLGEIDNTIVVDSARPEVIQLLRDQGYTVRGSKKGAGSVIRGIDKLNRFHAIRFYEGTEDAYEEMSKLGFDNSENIEGDRDFCDAVRYGVEKIGAFQSLSWDEVYSYAR